MSRTCPITIPTTRKATIEPIPSRPKISRQSDIRPRTPIAATKNAVISKWYISHSSASERSRSCHQTCGEALEDPIGGGAANGVGGGAGGPVRDLPHEPSRHVAQQQHHGDEGQLTEFHADIEGEQRQRDLAMRQADLCQRSGKSEPMEQPETEGDQPRIGSRDIA